MRLFIINGPNLNLVGVREPDVYGSQTLDSYFKKLEAWYPDIKFTFFQSNSEGAIIDCLQQTEKEADGVILNAGGYTHTSVAVADAISAISTPVIEVHLSNVHKRESFRHHSFLSPVVEGVISGFGLDSYRLAVEAYLKKP